MRLFKKTKIVATISDKNCSIEFLKSLYEEGMDVVRLNTAHQTTEEALKVINNVRKVSSQIAILVDTKGPEIRTNAMEKAMNVAVGDIIKIKGEPGKDCTKEMICVSYKNFVQDIELNTKILIDDGILELTVIEKTKDYLSCRVENSGKIEGHKSINIPSAFIKLPSLSKKGIDFIEFAAEQNLDFIAHSFVRSAADVIAVQSILDACSSDIKIISKIENAEGVKNIDEILDISYGIMVARGDLAIEISSEKLPVVQRTLIEKAIEKRKPVIVATQMLHSMIQNPRPTRAEVNDIANALFEGTDAVMLSGETAYGKFPIESVKMMTKIIWEVESSLPDFRDTKILKLTTDVSAYLVKAAIEASSELDVKVIIADTLSGSTVRELAAYRSKNLVFAQCYDKNVARELALSFGVYAQYILPKAHHQEFINDAIKTLLTENQAHENDLIVIVAGSLGYSTGTTFIEIGEISKLLKDRD